MFRSINQSRKDKVKESGKKITFKKGDTLHVIDTSDATRWRASLEGQREIIFITGLSSPRLSDFCGNTYTMGRRGNLDVFKLHLGEKLIVIMLHIFTIICFC